MTKVKSLIVPAHHKTKNPKNLAKKVEDDEELEKANTIFQKIKIVAKKIVTYILALYVTLVLSVNIYVNVGGTIPAHMFVYP